jgi:hypothetical protein
MVLRYLDFRQRWPAVTDALGRDSYVRDQLMGDVRGI